MSIQKILKHKITPIIALFLFSLTIRILLISKGPYHADSLNLALMAERTLDTSQLQRLFGFGYPVTILCGSLFIFIFRCFNITDPVFATNFMSVFFTALCVPLLYIIASYFSKHKTAAILGAIIFSLTPIFLGISVYGKSHAPSIFFLLLAIIFLIKNQKKHQYKYIIYSACSMGLMGACRLHDMILIAPTLSFLYVITSTKHFTKSPFLNKKTYSSLILYWFYCGLTAIVFHIPYFFQGTTSSNHYTSQLSVFWNLGVTLNFHSLFSPHLKLNASYLLTSFTWIGLISSTLGLMLTRQRLHILFLLSWILIPFLFYGNLETGVPRFLALITPAIALCISIFFSNLLQRKWIIIKVTTFILFLIITLFSFSDIYPILSYRHRFAQAPDYSRWLKTITPPQSFIISGDDQKFIYYYGQRQTLRRPTNFYHIAQNNLDLFKIKLDQMLSQNIPVYITSIGLYDNDPDEVFSNFMKKNYTLNYIDEKRTEDWHKGELTLKVMFLPLYKIEK